MESKLYKEMEKYIAKKNLTYSESLLLKDFCWDMEIKYGKILNRDNE